MLRYLRVCASGKFRTSVDSLGAFKGACNGLGLLASIHRGRTAGVGPRNCCTQVQMASATSSTGCRGPVFCRTVRSSGLRAGLALGPIWGCLARMLAYLRALADVVVGERRYPSGLPSRGQEYQHAGVVGSLPELLRELHAVHCRHHQVVREYLAEDVCGEPGPVYVRLVHGE